MSLVQRLSAPLLVPLATFLAAGGATAQLLDGLLPAGEGGSGTELAEPFQYQLPPTYDLLGPAYPLVVAFHGSGMSAASTASLSTIDEECAARGWLYLAPTGGDDQLYGSPVCRQNLTATIEWMQDNHNVDADRIYMVGFSLGGGIVTNYAARHRDPAGLMIASIGTVAGSYDWTMSWKAGSSVTKDLLEHPLNFGGTPEQEPFLYREASALFFDPDTYPLYLSYAAAVLDPTRSMASNLATTPVWMTWDSLDLTKLPKAQNLKAHDYLVSLGGVVEKKVVTATSEPHSWSVLDEVALFDFFDGRVVDRTPSDFDALLPEGGAVSWASLAPRAEAAFSRLKGSADVPGEHLSVTGIENAREVAVDAGLAGLGAPADLRVTVANTNIDAEDFELQIGGLDTPPAYFVDPVSGALLHGTSSDPLAGALLHEVQAGDTFDGALITDPLWNASLVTTPEVGHAGDLVSLTLDAPAGSIRAWILIGAVEGLTRLPGGSVLTIADVPSTQFLSVALDPSGDAQLDVRLPVHEGLKGQRLLLQAVAQAPDRSVAGVSNRWTLSIE